MPEYLVLRFPLIYSDELAFRLATDKNSKILEIGAGTGRYSIALVKEGMNVTAVELVDKNWKIR